MSESFVFSSCIHCRRLSALLALGWMMNGLVLTAAFAQQPATYSVGHANVRKWTLRDGLSQISVNTILQDRQGFMWFGTQDGLNKFDGYNFKVYEHIPGDSTTISDNHIRHIYEDSEGLIWLGTRNGLSRLDPVTDKSYVYTSSNKPTSLNALVVTSIVQDKSGYMWMGTGRVGLRRLDVRSGHFRPYVYNPQDPSDTSLGAFKKGFVPSPHNQIFDVAYSPPGDVWMSTGGGIMKWNTKKKTFQAYQGKYPDLGFSQQTDPVHLKPQLVHVDNNGVVWVASEKGGLYKLIPGAADFEKVVLPPEISSKDPFFHVIAEGSENSLWLTSQTKLYRYFPQTNRFVFYPQAFTKTEEQEEEHILSVMEDRSGIVWVGSELGGIRQLDIQGGGFHRYQPPFLKANKVLKQYREDREGNLWLTTTNEIIRFNKRTSQTRVLGPAQNPLVTDSGTPLYVSCLFADRQGNVWIGSNSGLLCWEQKAMRFRKYIHDEADSSSITDNEIATVYQDEAGSVWVGTGIGINRLEAPSGSFRQFFVEGRRRPSAANYGGVIVSLNKNELLVGTGRGLSVFNKKTEIFRHFRRSLAETSPDSISNDQITCLYKSTRGQVWVGTSNGLNLFDPVKKRFRSFYTRDGLPNNFIAGILEDDQGYLWISTNKGISRFEPAKQTFQNYDKIEGTNTAEFYNASAYKAPSGELFFGSIDGLVSFDPKSIRPNQAIPPVLITNYRVFDKKLALLDKHLEIDYEQNHIGFDFVALNYLNPEKNRYAYRLDGFDRDWTYCGSRRFTNYTNLSPGNYTFRVKAANNDGVWNEGGAAVTLTILPPWYHTGWAYILYTAMLLTGVLLARNAIIKRERLRADLRIRQVEAEKFKELDTLKSHFFANISHELRTPLTLILNIVKDKHKQCKVNERGGVDVKVSELQVLERNAGRLLNLIEQLLDLSRLESGRLQRHDDPGELMGFLRYVVASFHSLAQTRGIAFTTDLHPESLWVLFDRDKVEKIIVNLLSNAFKFTPEGGEIRVITMATQEATGVLVEIRVQDSGIGIPAEELSRIFDRFYQVDASAAYEGSGIGLALSKELVQLYGGTIGVESWPERGATFTVKLLLASAMPAEGLPDAPTATESVLFAPDDEPNAGEESLNELETETVLVVEDNPDLRAYLKECLKESYRVLEAVNGRQGWEQGLQAVPDLIISDVMMPEMDGFTLCEKIKTDERTSHIPLILLTAKAGQKNKLTGLQTGADDYLIKPFDAQELLIRTRNLLDIRKKLRERYSREFVLQPAAVSLSSADERFLSKLREAIEKNMGDENFSVEGLGEEMAMSRVQLYRKLFALTNQSPSDLLRRMRLQRARQLFVARTGNVSDVAFGVGYKNLAHFSKSFAKEFGVSPSEFLRAQEEKA